MKKLVLIIILALLLTSAVFATISSPLFFWYKLRRVVAEDVLSYHFSADAAGTEDITNTQKALDVSLGLTDPQFYLYGTTNWKSPYGIVLIFTPLVRTSDGEKYTYSARVYTSGEATITNSSPFTSVSFNAQTKEDVLISFRGGATDTYGQTASFCYPVSFLIENLDSGTYQGTITLEVGPE